MVTDTPNWMFNKFAPWGVTSHSVTGSGKSLQVALPQFKYSLNSTPAQFRHILLMALTLSIQRINEIKHMDTLSYVSVAFSNWK